MIRPDTPREMRTLRDVPTRLAVATTGLVFACAPAARGADTTAYPQGAAAFQSNCAVCHGPAGAGIPSLAPPLSPASAPVAASPARAPYSPMHPYWCTFWLLFLMTAMVAIGLAPNLPGGVAWAIDRYILSATSPPA